MSVRPSDNVDSDVSDILVLKIILVLVFTVLNSSRFRSFPLSKF